MKLESWHGPNRRVIVILNKEQAEDIIRNCLTKDDELIFAKKYKISQKHASQIRKGYRWKWLRDKISSESK